MNMIMTQAPVEIVGRPEDMGPHNARINNLLDEIQRLSRDRASAESAYQTARELHRNDIALISSRLLSEAEDRGWCQDFDDFVESINRDLHVELEPRKRDFRVTCTFEIYVDVVASTEAQAEELAAEKFRGIEREIDMIEATTGACYRGEITSVDEN